MKKEKFYNYTNYRTLLEDLYSEKKEKNQYFSYRAFSQKAGLKSPNYLQQVLNGARNLTQKSVLQVAKAFGLKNEETEYLENLVFMNQGETREEKEYYYYKLVKNRQFIRYNKLRKKQLNYYSKWYHVAIRELLTFNSSSLTAKQISEKLNPKIAPGEVKEAIKLLENLGLIKKKKDGSWIQTSVHVSTGDEVDSLMVAKFHRMMSDRALDCMEKVDPEFCNISSITVPAKKETFTNFIEILSSFRKELLKLSEKIEEPEEVMQINFQLFPLTNVKKKISKKKG